MANQIVVSAGAKVRDLQDVIIGTSGVLTSLGFDVANGVPKLDVNGKILVSQLPNSVMEYKGTWDASTNTPTLANGTGNQGDVYLCNVAGTVNFGAGAIAFFVGDQVIYSGSIWQRASGATGTVTSVSVTETGDSLNITGSPITTSGTINIGFNGTNLQYVNGAGNLTTFPILTGYVPYTGATQDVDLGAFKLNAQSLHIKGTAGNGHLGLKHQSVAATGSANESLIYADSLGDLSWQNANLYLSKFITSANTANRSYTFPNATCNIPDDALVVHLAGTETITGAKTFSGYTTFTSTVDITSGLTFSNSGFTLVLQPPTLSVNRTVTLPNGTGTLALTSDLASYVPYTGATGSVNLGAFLLTASGVDSVGYTARGSGTLSGYLIIKQGTTYLGNVVGYNSINANARKYVFISDVDGTNYKSAIFELSSLTNNTDRTYTLPDATGTIALVGGSGVGTVTSVAALTIGTTGTDLSSSVANSTTTPVITLNVPTASATNRGALASADWTTFNGKQAQLNGTGFVKATGTTISYDNTNYLPLTGGTLTGALSGTSGTFTQLGAGVTPINLFSVRTGTNNIFDIYDNGTGPAIQSVNDGVTLYRPLFFFATAFTFSNSVTATSFVKTSGTSSQFLKADGSVDSTAYGTGSVTSVGLSSATSGVTIGSSPITTSGTITLAIATATTSQNGLLSSADWTTFNNKQDALTNPVTGTGTTNYLPKFTGTSTIGNSNLISQATGLYLVGSEIFTTVNGGIFFNGNGSYATGIYAYSTSNNLRVIAPTQVELWTGSTQRLTIDSSGNLGLGVTPSAWAFFKAVQVNGGNSFVGYNNQAEIWSNSFYDGASKYYANGFATRYAAIDGRFEWYQAPSGTAGAAITFTQAMTLTASGNLSIGNTVADAINSASGLANLVVGNGGGSSQGITIYTNSSTYGGLNFADATSGGGAYAGYIKFDHSNDSMGFFIGNTTRLNIDSSGRTSIGYTTNPSTYQLDVNGTGSFSGSLTSTAQNSFFGQSSSVDSNIYIQAGYDASNKFVTQLRSDYFGAFSIGTTLMPPANSPNTGTYTSRLSFALSGAATFSSSVTATSFFESSDSRLKTLIQDNYQTKGIASITPKLYTKNGKVELGYYAQDFVGVLDSAVSKGEDDMLSLSYREVHTAKIYALEQEIKELKAKMN